MMSKVGFIILHYCAVKMTEQCVESIMTVLELEEYKIVVVDNCSPDGSGNILKEKYKNIPEITVLTTEKNVGFSKGNNIGYSYLREKYLPDLLVVLNNDTVFQQKNFVHECCRLYKEFNYDVLGPDIVNLRGFHQNPHRACVLTERETNRLLFTKTVFLLYFYVKKILHIGDHILILEKMFQRKDQKNRNKMEWQKQRENVVLQGSCLVFSRNYIEQEKEQLFLPVTFMYGEEDILSYLCQKKGYKIMYTPDLQILHYEGISTKEKKGKELDKNIFMYKHMIYGLRKLKALMNQ